MRLLRIKGGLAQDAIYKNEFVEFVGPAKHTDRVWDEITSGLLYNYSISEARLTPQGEAKVKETGYPVKLLDMRGLYEVAEPVV